MSAYGHQMEREYSAQSLSSTGGSEMGSRYTMETGIYMSSFAATVFISGIVTAGVSLLALLIALAVMLQSCENTNSGALQIYKDIDSYSYCKSYALHAELNSLDVDFFPAICKDVAVRYINEGQYMRDLNMTVGIAENFFSRERPLNDSRDIVLMDADDFFTSENLHSHLSMRRINKDAFHDSSRVKNMFAVKLYLKLQAGGWPLILISRKPETLRDATTEHLASVGCGGWSSLIMRMDNETQMDSQQHFSKQRTALQKEGFQIIATISSQMDAVRGPCLGERVFKLPTPMFNYKTEDYVGSTNL
ncbi:Uncharacterized protein Fot_02832 [Forsythia ovata]|uniref:Acid phosphatase n=1 Tax=Forsythia ovata TaxID=205694 RepID=A0ABD1XB24_9LAMI